MRRHQVATTSVLLLIAALPLAAQQDTNSFVRLGVRGTSGQPGLAVLAGTGLDSVRTIVQRDLENSNRYTIPHLNDSSGTLKAALDPNALKSLGLAWALELEPAAGGIQFKLYDIATGTIRQQGIRPLDVHGTGDSRMVIHRFSDEVVEWLGGTGIAASRIAFKMDSKDEAGIWRIDSDGANLVRISHSGTNAIAPAWSPDATAVAFSEFRDGRWTLFVQRLASATRAAVPDSSPGDSFGANFSPDGKTMAFAHRAEKEKDADVASADVSPNRMCCAHLLTHEGTLALADNVTPTYSPDGRRIAYVSNRTGTPEIWVMDSDGTSRHQLIPSEFGADGRSLGAYKPAWSPDGAKIVFGRDTPSGGRQLYSVSIASGQVMPLTSQSRNEDPSWAPDSRHVVFKSGRTGKDQLWILDIESSALRQLVTPDGARYPAWSHVFGNNP